MDYSHPKTPIFLPAAQVASSAKGKDNWPTALQLPTYLQHVCSKQRLRVSLEGNVMGRGEYLVTILRSEHRSAAGDRRAMARD